METRVQVQYIFIYIIIGKYIQRDMKQLLSLIVLVVIVNMTDCLEMLNLL